MTPRPNDTARARVRSPRRIVAWVAGSLAVLVIAALAFAALSPWPSVWLVRASAPDAGLENADSASRLVPDGIDEQLDVVYDPSSAEGRLDVFRPVGARDPLPTIFWMHGGGFIGGSKEPVQNYLRIVASHGFTVVNVEYTHAPEATYPTPLLQLDAAIRHIAAHQDAFLADLDRVVIAGDSAGAHMAAQATMAIADSEYAAASGLPAALRPEQVVGTVQFSGPYDPTNADYSNETFGFFMRTVMWAYSGDRDFLSDERFSWTDLPSHVNDRYPATFVSTGPHDPLQYQGTEWVEALTAAGVPSDVLSFDAATTDAAVGHEYQLDFSTDEAHTAMERMVAFLRDTTGATYREGVSDAW